MKDELEKRKKELAQAEVKEEPKPSDLPPKEEEKKAEPSTVVVQEDE